MKALEKGGRQFGRSSSSLINKESTTLQCAAHLQLQTENERLNDLLQQQTQSLRDLKQEKTRWEARERRLLRTMRAQKEMIIKLQNF